MDSHAEIQLEHNKCILNIFWDAVLSLLTLLLLVVLVDISIEKI